MYPIVLYCTPMAVKLYPTPGAHYNKFVISENQKNFYFLSIISSLICRPNITNLTINNKKTIIINGIFLNSKMTFLLHCPPLDPTLTSEKNGSQKICHKIKMNLLRKLKEKN